MVNLPEIKRKVKSSNLGFGWFGEEKKGSMMIRSSRLVSLVFVGQLTLSAAMVALADSSVEFEMEVQERMFANQISAVREGAGEVCSRAEIPYWEQLASEYLSNELPQQAEAVYFRLLRTCIREKKINHPNTLEAADSLVRYYHSHSLPEKVDNLIAEILSASEQELGHDNILLVSVLDYLADVYRKIGNELKREEMLVRALRIAEKSSLGKPLDIPQSQLRLADMYFSQQKLSEAEPLYRKASLAIFAMQPRFDKSVLALREQLVKLYWLLEKWAEAEAHMNELIVYFHEVGGDSHPVFIRALGQMTVIYANQSKYSAAYATVDKAISLSAQGGEKTSELLVSLQQLRSQLDTWIADAIKTGTQCSDQQRELRYVQSMQWNETLESVRSRAEKLLKRIEFDDLLAGKLKLDNPADKQLLLEKLLKEIAADDYFASKFRGDPPMIQHLLYQERVWGDSTLAESCLSELAEYDKELERYLAVGQTLYTSWDTFHALCVEQGNQELAEIASTFRSHHYDADLNVSMLRSEVLGSLQSYCLERKRLDDAQG